MAVLMASMLTLGIYTVNNLDVKYQAALQKIQSINSAKAIVINNSFNYNNEGEKYADFEIEEDLYVGYQHRYVNHDGIKFFSTSEHWDEEKLKAVETELYSNTHGDEIRFLDKVVVYGSSGGYAAGAHSNTISSFELPVSLYSFLPDEAVYYSPYVQSNIFIYGVYEYTKIEDIARVISHEYGHHYTKYHFGLNFDESDQNSEYFKLRLAGLEDTVLYRESYDHYVHNHMWYLAEIAAEDYMYLMGSENTRNTFKFYDHKEKASYYKKDNMDFIEDNGYRVADCSNAIPHENASLELPLYIDGLDDYFYSFVDEKSPFTDSYDKIGSLNLSMEYLGINQYKFTWDMPYKDSNVIYTLIAYDAADDSIETVVRTRRGNQRAEAWFGNFTGIQISAFGSDAVEYFEDINLLWYCKWKEQMTFRVSITFPDGIVLLSDPITVTWE